MGCRQATGRITNMKPSNRASVSPVKAKNSGRRRSGIKVQWPLTIITTDSGLNQGVVDKITDVGIFMTGDDPLVLKTLYRVRIKPPNCRRFELTCKMIWSDIYGIGPNDIIFGMGRCFLQTSKKDSGLFSEMISLASQPPEAFR